MEGTIVLKAKDRAEVELRIDAWLPRGVKASNIQIHWIDWSPTALVGDFWWEQPNLHKKRKCRACGTKVVPKEPRTLEEAIERIESMPVIVQLQPWMMKFFEWRTGPNGQMQYKVKEGAEKSQQRRDKKREKKKGKKNA